MMLSMPASSLPLKEEVAKAETVVDEATRELEGEIRLAEVNHLVLRGSK